MIKQVLIGFLVESENIKQKHNMLGYENFSMTTKSNYFVIRQLYFSFSYFLLPFVNYSQLKGLDLDGTLPDEFGNLSYLQEL